MSLQDASEVVRIDSKSAGAIASKVEDYDALVHDAAAATQEQVDMSVRQAIRAYPKAIMWSMIFSMAIIMEGFDVMLLGNYFAQPAFTKRYGNCNAAGKCEIPAPWQSGLNNGALVGEIFGLQLTGIASERFGYKKTMLFALIMMIGTIFIPFFANSLAMLLAGQILQGIPWGVFQTLTTAYAAEVCPVTLRPYLTTWVNACWVIGQLISTGVLRATVNWDSQWAYRLPYALQWMWPVPILIGCIFAPESPWWLVRQGRHEDAKRAIKGLRGSKVPFSDADAQQQVAMMVHTDELEKAVSEGSSYWDCFKRTDLRRTEIACVVWLCQHLSGSPLMGASSYFYVNAGLPTTQAFNMSIGQFAMGLCGTIASWFVIKHVGRRTIYLYGQIVMCALMLLVGGLGFKQDSEGFGWAIGSSLLIFAFIYDFTVGPVCYSLVAEVSSTRLRAKTIVLARNVYNIGGLIVNIIQPRMLNTTAWNWGAKCAFLWAGTCFLCIIWTYYRLPEPRGRTYGELDILFEQKVSARKFSSTKVDQFGDLTRRHQAGMVEKAAHHSAGDVSPIDDKSSSTEKITLDAPVGELAYEKRA
ncbi:uncharacterized protein PFL1_01148 [Pseudozyma flocculosa PF-1]|uniref:uncharacterized protein n=1 Tax=Pseudozyma flocculosa PF-1 TaxID=1277687 RepID=UPI0004561593|nr:uncharacterized protein PFL1_01148 [Pseudozyma flocculosa PF-1]EPQ30959.1 hypothetical protein PFL1_01148 [Pseudozyma flocculosa PF-1]